MKITELHIEGFRSLKNVTWNPGDLNVVIGPNGSGKSNLLRLLEMISASAQGRLSRYVQNEGGIRAIVWDGQVDSILFFLRTGPLTKQFDYVDINYDLNIPEFTYNFAIYRFGPTNNYFIQDEDLLDSSKIEYIRRRRLAIRVLKGDFEHPIEIGPTSFTETESVLSKMDNPFFTEHKSSMLQNQLSLWHIYNELRFDKQAEIRQPPISRQEQQVDADGQNLINVLHTHYTNDREFKRSLNTAMSAAFGDAFDELIFSPDAGDQRIQMRVRWKTLKRDQSTADLSDGTLRFLFLLTVLANPTPPPLIAIDEPETGLHPSMLPIIAEFAISAAERTQVIFTTHSDQFLDAFRGVKPTTTVAKWEDGETKLTVLDEEQLAQWLQEYTLGDLFRSGTLENIA